ncbi:ribonuclease H2 subunit C-like [Argiope bruennichi]|uniref:Ribonuclease H2 subunit C like protein n=1 Tax=Argiope bruennichi TaxID=94029 RepID=A0A8T0F3G8_ARGBR|nr:ribonuclease H2 subunit C-like [Argiope bruennichi]KAF8783489.1 Ribonuclease H2 subunit C like protein [Argiope bruennichi]
MTSISLGIPAEKVEEDLICHLIPCKINYNGTTNVSDYFTPFIREQDGHFTSSIRGHPLKGQKVKIPDGYTGVVLKENKKFTSDDKKDLKKFATFKEFTAWNWDIIPSSEDKLIKALEWMDVAFILHKPVSEYTDDKKDKSHIKRKFGDVEK